MNRQWQKGDPNIFISNNENNSTMVRLSTDHRRTSLYYSILTVKPATTEGHLSSSHILHMLFLHMSASVSSSNSMKKSTEIPYAPYATRYWVDHTQCINRHWVRLMPEMHPTRLVAITFPLSFMCGFLQPCGYASKYGHLIARPQCGCDAHKADHLTPLHLTSGPGTLKIGRAHV